MKYKKEKKNMYVYHIKEMLYVTTCRKALLKFGLYGSLFLLALLIALLPHFIIKRNHQPHYYMRFPTDLKYVLVWNPPRDRKKFFSSESKEFPTGQKAFIQQKCPYINCYITYNKSLLNKDESFFDAVIFNAQDISKLSININDLNITRSTFQKYIFRSQESAEKHPVCHHMFDNFFNVTWTYKLNSDIPQPFINIYDVNNKLVGPKKKVNWITKMNHTNHFKNKKIRKNKAIAWIVAKCRTKNKHKDFITDLRSELKGYNYSIDIYGPCGDKKCPDDGISSCYKMMEKEYFFQLVLEDSFASDYVTEKTVKALMRYSIPIIAGGANYTRFLPPGSYINAASFTPKKLGALIDYLIKNPKTYEYFFDWKNHYFFTVRPRSYVCDLCAQLNLNSTPVTYKHFRRWWNPDYKDICERMKLLSMFSS